MKKKASKVVKNATAKSKKLKDMSVDDFMQSFGEGASDSGSEDEQDHAPQPQAQGKSKSVNGVNGNHAQSSDEDENDDSAEEEDAGDGESGEDEELDGEEESGDDEELDEEEVSGEDEELDGEEDSGDDEGEENDSGGEDDEEDAADSEADSGDEMMVGSKHKKSLNKLKDLDPEFYKYLQENDKKLLQFNASDSESESEADGDEQVHRPGKLDSDESDFEGGDDDDDEDDDDSSPKKRSGTVTLKMVEKWRASLQSEKSVQTISDAVEAFHAALMRVAPEDERSACAYKVDGSAVFNAVVQMCVLDLLPALRRYLNLSEVSLNFTNPAKCKRWSKVKTLLRSYVTDLLQLLQGVASVNISTVVLKHLHQMTPFVVCFSVVTKQFVKRMINLWSTGEETVRVVAFMCLLRATSLQKNTLLDQTLRHMYLAYVQNTKFISPNTLPGISFMRRSLAEMFLLDENVSYQHAFMYIRQLAIHLRNAITLQKKEATQSVNNWQFFSSLALWVEVLGASNKTALQPLLYPVVQIIVGAIKLTPTAQYFPQRFHAVRLLVNLSKSTGIFIPVLPFLLEILNSYDFNKKHTKVSMKPLDFSCILRVSKTQQQENGFKDAVIENIYSLLLESLSNDSQSVAFPDLALPTIFQIREFQKKCKVANYTRKFRQILEKIEENSKFIEIERKTAAFKLSDTKAIEDWETAVRVKGTPLEKFCTSWMKMNAAREAKLKKDTIDISENLPKINRNLKRKKGSAEGPVTLLPSDDSDSDGADFGDDDDDDEEVAKKPRGKRGKKTSAGAKKKVKISHSQNDDDDGAADVVEDMNLSEW
ncbi:nucleolar complex protein 2 homolog [Thrips palmi]|uniref:Nucleolar complex protein 2 homolog n=1 Tax=Thrips palmi TaxID=161013 RepID=A0A6P8ZRT2_THRPL|nr:nucleolar complex protein 2 homolog [Thrips palmi]